MKTLTLLKLCLCIAVLSSPAAQAQNEGPRFGFGTLIAIDGELLDEAKVKSSGGKFLVFNSANDSEGFAIVEFAWSADKALVGAEKLYTAPIPPSGEVRTARGTQDLQHTENGWVLKFTPPGPQVLRIPVATIRNDPREVHIEVKEVAVVVPEDKIADVKVAMKADGFKGSDEELDTFVRQRAIRETRRLETWLVRSVEIANEVSLEALLSSKENPSIRKAVLNVSGAWNKCIDQVIALREKTEPSPSDKPVDPEQIFKNALQKVLQR